MYMFRYINSTFSLLRRWTSPIEFHVGDIDFDEKYVILQDESCGAIHDYFPNGVFAGKIERFSDTAVMAYQNGKLVTGGEDKVLRVWDVETGLCLLNLEGHNGEIVTIEIQDKNIVINGDDSGLIIV